MEHAPEDTRHDVEQSRSDEAHEVELDSVTLARLLAEVRNEEVVEAHAYNRMHNRHNR